MPRPSSLPAKQCERCGKGYVPQSNRQRYCSQLCHYPPRDCAVCGKSFTPTRHSSGEACSRSCSRRLLWQRWGKQPDKPCAVCGKPISGSQRQRFCSRECLHASQRRPGTCYRCGKPTSHARNRYCSRRCAAVVAARQARRERSPGDRVKVKGGYVKVKQADGSWALEHRVVMESMLGRKLRRRENVHHKNGRRGDNRPENLELWHKPQPTGTRRSDHHCPGCRCFEKGTG